MAFNKTLTNELIHALTEDENRPKGLRALNTTLYTLTPEQIRNVLEKQTGLMVISLTAEIEPGEDTKKALLGAMEQCKELEQVEIVANPSLMFFMGKYFFSVELCLPSECDFAAAATSAQVAAWSDCCRRKSRHLRSRILCFTHAV